MYKTIVRPCLEYSAAVWGPSRQIDVARLERVQRQAVRWVHGGLGRDGSVTDARVALGLDELSCRRAVHDGVLLGGMFNGEVDVTPPALIAQTNPYPTRSNLIHASTNTSLLFNSFFLRAVRHK